MLENYTVITFEKKGPVAEVFLNRPDKSNAMNPPFWPEIREVFLRIHQDPEIRVAVVAGKGKNFSSGLDLVASAQGFGGAMGSAEMDSLFHAILQMQESFNAIEECKKPVIAAIHGACIGGGLDLVAACDIRLASADARFSLREARVAMISDLGSLNRLPHIIGQGHARELAFTGKDITAERALRIGLVNDVFPDPESCLAAARELAQEIASAAPLAVQGAKEVMNYSRDKSLRDGLAYAAARSCLIIKAGDLMEAVTAFMQKRKPAFKGK
ncbi:MAG: enoyl-CoA hydratase [Deltaproteobacteria bacterium RBG_13_61_14]|nr:MAG: enoyl-CoA hydratase [Deltaproteobacteria bacterium RBG_13_61_14]